MTDESVSGLRARKKVRNRAAIIAAATRLFEERGYAGTTLAQIAAEADIAPRTLYGYFPDKASVLFPESEDRIKAAVTAVAELGSESNPVEALLHALDATLQESDDVTGDLARVRSRLIGTEPEVEALGARFQHRAAREIARALEEVHPELGPVRAGALAGAFVGAAAGAITATLDVGAASGGADIRAAVADAFSALRSPPPGRWAKKRV